MDEEYDWTDPDDLALLQASQKRRFKSLNKLATWTTQNLEDVLLCHHVYLPEVKTLGVPVSFLKELAFDSRTPDVSVPIFLKMVRWGEATDNEYIHRYSDWQNYGK